jgi:hypothetical protein
MERKALGSIMNREALNRNRRTLSTRRSLAKTEISSLQIVSMQRERAREREK